MLAPKVSSRADPVIPWEDLLFRGDLEGKCVRPQKVYSLYSQLIHGVATSLAVSSRVLQNSTLVL
jgi:hypothetical protein